MIGTIFSFEDADAKRYFSTSPSIYANFHGIVAGDFCGLRGSTGSIPATMLAFSPGELSTIAGPIYNTDHPATSQFNFADLPCPPQSVMVFLALSLSH